MANISIFGKGNMGSAIGGNFEDAGNKVTYFDSKSTVDELEEIVVLAVPYPGIADIVGKYKDKLAGKIVIEISNALNPETYDDLVVPADSSVAAEIAKQLPDSHVIKAFNTNFSATLKAKKIGNEHQTTVLMAADDEGAKKTVADALEGSGLAMVDAGPLKRARELEAIGFLMIKLAISEKISQSGGFGVFK